jgi:dTDP-4-dehydrorhamnose 3,5-epimerase
MELFIGQDRYQLVRIPPGVINGWKAVGVEPVLLANCATLPHQADEMKRYDPFGDTVPYDWAIKMR